MQAVEEENNCMIENCVWTAVAGKDAPEGAKVITSTWAIKKKANGTYIARLNAIGSEQVGGEHYNSGTMRLRFALYWF